MDLSTITSLAVLDIFKNYIWIPLLTILMSAVGLHIKADRSARKEHQDDIKEIHERITKEHTRVEDHYVRKDALEPLVRQIEAIAADVEYIRRKGDKDV